MTYELASSSVGILWSNIGLLGTGMALGIIGLLFAISRGITKNSEHWAILFGVLGLTISLIIPTIGYASLVFMFSMIAIILSISPLAKKLEDGNIYILAILSLVLNLILLISAGAFGNAQTLNWQENYDQSYLEINDIIGNNIEISGNSIQTAGLCPPNQQATNTSECQSDAISGTFDPNLFVPFASILTIGTYIGKAIAFMGMAILAPLVITNTIINGGYIQQEILLNILMLLVIIWQISIFYKTALFILNRQ